MKGRKLFVSDPWIIKEYVSDKPNDSAQKAEFLIIYQVNIDGEDICYFTYEELQQLCKQYNLDYDLIKESFYELLDVEYRINQVPIKPYKKVKLKDDGIYIELDERIVDHYYNPLSRMEY